MGWIQDLFNQLSKIFQWWIIVMPWERGIRVRFGKTQTLLKEGIYLKLPLVDRVFVQSIRLRYMGVPIQTVTSKDGNTITISTSVGYTISDIEKLYNSIYSPNATLSNMVMGEVAQYVASHTLSECLPVNIENGCTEKLKINNYGLNDVTVKVIGYAVVRTYRLIQDQSWFPETDNNLSSPKI